MRKLVPCCVGILGLVATGIGRAQDGQVANVLDSLAAAARAGTGPAERGLALAHVARTAQACGDDGRTAELITRSARETRACETPLPRARALARLGAALDAQGDTTAARAAFGEALATIGTALAAGGEEKRLASEIRRTFAAYVAALADARSSVKSDDPLVSAALDAVAKLDPRTRAVALDESAAVLARLGWGEKVRELACELIGSGKLELLHVEHAVGAIEAVSPGKPLASKELTKILEALDEHVSEIDEFAPPVVVSVLRSEGAPSCVDLAKKLGAKDPYVALLVRLGGLRRIAESADKKGAREALFELLKDALAHAPPGAEKKLQLERMRILVRVLRVVPSLGLEKHGFEVVRSLVATAQAETSLSVANELYAECAQAAAKLAPAEDARALSEEIATKVLARWQKESAPEAPPRDGEGLAVARSTDPKELLFESLASCAESLGAVGEKSPKAVELVKAIAAVARKTLEELTAEPREDEGEAVPAEPVHDLTRAVLVRKCLVQCTRAAVLLGVGNDGRGMLSAALVEVPDAPPTDEIEVLTAALHAAKGLPVRVRRDMVGSAGRALIRRTPGVSMDEWNQFFALAHELMAEKK